MSEATGQKPINKICRMCAVDLVVGENITEKRFNKAMYFCQPCERIEIRERQMYVNGKYIKKDHPLHKAGKYKGFTDAAFSSLKGYETVKNGFIYILHNASFPGWIKVGMAIDVEDRIKQFQTASPYRDYQLIKSYKVEDRREAEVMAHEALDTKGVGRRGEWFYVSHAVATTKLDKIFPEAHQFELF